MMKAEDLLRSLEGAFASELDLYRQLEALSVRQLEALERPKPDIDLTVKTMQAKCEIVQQVTSLEKEHSPLREQYSNIRDSIPEESKSKLRELRDELDGILRRLIELEKEGEQRMKESSQQLEKRLLDVTKVKKARNAYSAYQKSYGPSKFLDKKR